MLKKLPALEKAFCLLHITLFYKTNTPNATCKEFETNTVATWNNWWRIVKLKSVIY